MGWSFRKSFKIAPGVRLNLSKSGVGVSAGFKGARIGTGPRGSYFTSGFGPFLYREKLGQGDSRSTTLSSGDSASPFELQRPSNWHAWLFGVVAFYSNFHLIKPLGDTYSGYLFIAEFFVWLFILTKGPKSLKAYRRFKKTPIETMNAQDRLHFIYELYTDYKCLHFEVLLAKAHYEADSFEKAELMLTSLVRAYPIPMFYAALGDSQLKLGKFDKAIDSLSHCDEKDEYDEFMTILRLKARAYIGLREYDKALECVDTGIRKRGEQYVEKKRSLRLVKAEILHHLGETNKAVNELEKLIAEVPDDNTEAVNLLKKLKAA